MPNLIIINPGGGNVIYQNLDTDLTAIEPPLWARLIAGYCEDRGHSVEIVDMQFDVGEHVHETPLLYCIAAYGHQPSASTQSMEAVNEWVKAYKENGNTVPIIIVGGHAAALPERTLRETGADYVCTGEGPQTVEALLRVQKGDLGNVPGLAWINAEGEYDTTPAAPLLDLSELHGNTWDLLPMDKYRAHGWQCLDGSPRTPYASIYTSLNCPYKCVFCCISAPFGGPGYQTRNPDDVVAEVAHLYHEYGVTTIKIIDEMFILKKHHYRAICEGLAALPFAHELNIWCYGRADTVLDEDLALFRRAGIRWIALGIESGSEHVRDGAAKTLSSDDIRHIVHSIQAAGISVIANYIFGLSDDTMETMQETLDLAIELNTEFSNFYVAQAYPGSALFDQAHPADLPERWSGYSQHSYDTKGLPTDTLTSKEVLAFRDMAFDKYFTNPRYLNMLIQKFGFGASSEIRKMVSVKLERAA